MTVDLDLNLRGLTRDVLRTSTLADPSDIADEVYRRIGEDQLRAALRDALRVFVRQVISEERSHTTIRPESASPSAKVAAIRDYWQRSLRDRVHASASEWKLLGDCSAADLDFAAAERQEQAERNAAKARQYRMLARLVEEHGAARVRDLPADVLMHTLGRAA